MHQLIYKSLFQVVINIVKCPFSTRSFIALQIYRGDGEAEMKIKAEFLKMDGDRLVLLAL